MSRSDLRHLFERADGFFARDEERNDHVRKDDDVAQRQHRIAFDGSGRDGVALFVRHSLCPVPFDASRPAAMRCGDDTQEQDLGLDQAATYRPDSADFAP